MRVEVDFGGEVGIPPLVSTARSEMEIRGCETFKQRRIGVC